MESMLLVFSFSVPATPIYSNLQSLLRSPTVVGPAPLQSFRLNVSKALLSQLHLGLLPFSHPLYSLPNWVTVDSVSKKYLKSTNFSPTLCHPAGLVTWVPAVTLLHLLGFFPILFLKWKSATTPSLPPKPNPKQNRETNKLASPTQLSHDAHDLQLKSGVPRDLAIAGLPRSSPFPLSLSVVQLWLAWFQFLRNSIHLYFPPHFLTFCGLLFFLWFSP